MTWEGKDKISDGKMSVFQKSWVPLFPCMLGSDVRSRSKSGAEERIAMSPPEAIAPITLSGGNT